MSDLEELLGRMRKVRGVDNVTHIISLNQIEKDMLLDEIERLRGALREIAWYATNYAAKEALVDTQDLENK